MRRAWILVACVLLIGAEARAADLVHDYAEAYRAFLDTARTPYEVSREALALATEAGFTLADPADPKGLGELKPGDRRVFINRGLSVYAVVVGERPVSEGLRIVAAHADVPSLKLDTRPLKEGDGALLLKAHGYGGIKSYHYEGLPMAIRGVVVKKGGERVSVSLGGSEAGYVFMVRKLTTATLGGEKAERVGSFELIAASMPDRAKVKKPLRHTLLKVLNEAYGLTEGDLDSALLYAVPIVATRDVGVDRKALGGFGHDDRVCSFAALRALIDHPAGQVPRYTAMAVLIDREEIGSTGSTGMRSEYFQMAIGALLEAQGVSGENALRRAMRGTQILSSDVTAAVNPLFKAVHEPRNAPLFGRGPAMMKFTGRGGKVGGSEASAEFVRVVEEVFAEAGVPLQTSEIGRVDEGGGGTIAKFLAHQGASVLDLGVGLLSMHSPFELAHKDDMHHLYRGFSAFLWR